MRRLFALVLLLGLWTTPTKAAVVFFAGAETSAPTSSAATPAGEFASANNCVRATDQVRSGAYSYKCTFNGTSDLTTVGGFNLTIVYERFYFRLGGTPSVTVIVAKTQNSSNQDQLELVYNFTTKVLEYRYAGGSILASGSWALALNTWYLVEAKFVISASVGGAEVKIDNVVQLSDFTQATNSRGNIDKFVFMRTSGTTPTMHIDDIAISNSAYLGPGRIIARQGAAGSPTYDAWTKNSCSGGTIDNCWSETPFIAGTPNASSSTPTDAQTMLVHSFATTQSGHGTEVLASGDTINACKVGIVVKAAAGSQFYIRQRLGGADTDTLVNLTSADVYYEGPIFTDTFTNLNAAEIGAVQNSGP